MAAVLRVSLHGLPFRRQRGMTRIQLLVGEAAVRVLRAFRLHFDAQAAHAVRRPHRAARFVDVLPAFAARFAALDEDVTPRNGGGLCQRVDADVPVFARMPGAEAALPDPLDGALPARGEGCHPVAAQRDDGRLDAVPTAAFVVDFHADAMRDGFGAETLQGEGGGTFAFAGAMCGADLQFHQASPRVL